MVLKQRLSDGQTQFIDIGNNFVILTPASKEWQPQKDVHAIISYCDYNSKLQHEPLYTDFLHWIYSNDGQLFITLNQNEWSNNGPVAGENLLADFFNSKSDANKFLSASQQEELEKDFEEYINRPVDPNP